MDGIRQMSDPSDMSRMTTAQWIRSEMESLAELRESEITHLEEAFSFDDIPPKAKKKADLFLGRMQPIHLGHIKIIKKMKNPIVVLVKGAASSKDKSRNPLSADDQIKLLKKSVPSVRIVIAANGYLPAIFGDMRKQGFEIETLFAGADRLSDYERQVKGANAKLGADAQFSTKFKETERFTSATTVRNAIRTGDEALFKKLMPKELHSEFKWLQGKLS